MALDAARTATDAKARLKVLLEAAGLSSSDATTAADKAIDNLGAAIIEAVIGELRDHGETSGGETIL
jgi:hypothetical protein